MLAFCFNPYFTGCSTSTMCVKLCTEWVKASFNPYFTGCSTSTRHKASFFMFLYLFQSLFYWMFYFNPSSHIDPCTESSGSFNPYFTGCSTST